MHRSLLIIVVAILGVSRASGDSSSGGSPQSRSSTPAGAPARASERTFAPTRGVVCDRSTQICYQDSRASVSQTQAYFGDSAARRLQTTTPPEPKASHPAAKWILAPDVNTSCDMRTQVCYGSKGPSVKKTRKYFGDVAGTRLEQKLGGKGNGTITKEKHGVGCDQSVQVCYDKAGPSVKLTKKYFGEAAAVQLKKLLKR